MWAGCARWWDGRLWVVCGVVVMFCVEDDERQRIQVGSYDVSSSSFLFLPLQARIDVGAETIVGLNKYRLEKEDPIEVRQVDNDAVRVAQVARIDATKRDRDPDRAAAALKALAESARFTDEPTGPGDHPKNLLALAIEAAKARCTVGEISDALEFEGGWGRHVPRNDVVQGAYRSEFIEGGAGQEELNDTLACVEQFAEDFGRQVRYKGDSETYLFTNWYMVLESCLVVGANIHA